MKLLLVFFALLSMTWIAHSQQISGQVQALQTRMPLDRVRVTIQNMDDGTIDSVFTSNQGNWQYSFSSTRVNDTPLQPATFSISQNYPNPFNPSTWLHFHIPAEGLVHVYIHNSIGQLVDEKTQWLHAGSHRIQWQAKGPGGVYFYTIHFAAHHQTGKMVLLDGGRGDGLGWFMDASSNEALRKHQTLAVRIMADKFGYVSDTLQAHLSGGERFNVSLELVHNHAIMIDLHNDIIEKLVANTNYHLNQEHTYYHTDIPRLIKGGVDVQFFAIWVNPAIYGATAYQEAVHLIQLLKTEISANAQYMEQAFSHQDLLDIMAKKKIAAVIGVEGGHSIENDLNKLITLYNYGMRYMTITWNNSTSWAVSAQDSRSETVGLSDFGKKVITKLDSLGVLIDVSHVGKKTIKDILAIVKKPIIASHSGAYAVRAHYRNLDAEQIQSIAQRGGVVGVVFYPTFLSSNGVADIQSVIRHIDYIVNLVGVDFVAIGSDFDGIEKTPMGLEDVSRFPDLTLALLQHGYNRQDVEKILGTNFMRVFKQVSGLSF